MTPKELAAEIKAEARERVEAYLPSDWIERSIAGWPVEPLTVQRFCSLEALGNPFVGGGDITPESILQFLWVLDAGFPANKERRKKLVTWAAHQSYAQLIEACKNYMESQCADLPSGEVSGIPCASTAAYIVHLLAEKYGWTVQDIMVLPMQIVAQQLRLIQRSSDPTAIMFNKRSDAAKARYLSELHALNVGGNNGS